MCDYSAEGVWAKSGGACGIDDLPVSQELRDRMMQWQDWYERSPLYMIDEWNDLDIFSAEGESIARAVKAELPDWTVVYSNEAKSIAHSRENWHSPEAYQVPWATGVRSAWEYEIT
jgi:hypothetical protein